jgi:hypothetical protein
MPWSTQQGYRITFSRCERLFNRFLTRKSTSK